MKPPVPDSRTPTGKVLAVDVGEARIGVAVCDALGISVRPIQTIQRHSRRRDFDTLARIYAEEEANRIVCGLPLNMDGSEGPQAHKVRNWAERCARALRAIRGETVAVIFWDERLTSWAADEWIAAEGLHPAGQDAVAAAVILRSYLDAHREGRGEEYGRVELILPRSTLNENGSC